MKKKLSFEEMIAVKNRIQTEACESVSAKFIAEHHARTILNMATGAGKTRTAWKLIFNKYIPNLNSVLFMVPTIALVDQTLEEWSTLGVDFDYATIYTKGDIKSVEDFENFVYTPSNKIKVVFAVYNSIGIDISGEPSIVSQSDFQFDLAIYDECHRTVGKQAGMFTSCVEDVIVKAKYKLFMTATVKSYNAEDEDEQDLLNEFSMENKERFGEVAYSLTVFEAIRLGILCPFETYLLQVSDQRTRTMLKGKLRFLDEIVDGRHLAAAYSVLSAYEMGSRKIVVIFREHKDTRDFNNLFNYMQRELGLLKGAVIKNVARNVTPAELNAPSHITDKIQAQSWFMKEGPFTNSKSAIATASPWIKEGVDIPCIDTIVFGDRFSSGIDIIQIIGRALRWYDLKDGARIILPVMEGEANKVARSIQSTVANLNSDVEEFQIIRQDVSATQAAAEASESDKEEQHNEPKAPQPERWAYQPEVNEETRLEFNQGEVSFTVLHDSTFTPEARIKHDEMLKAVALKCTGNWKKYLAEQRALNFINDRIRFHEEGSSKNVRKYKTNEGYYEYYANMNNMSYGQAQAELEPYIYLIEEKRKKVVNSFFSLK